MTSNLFWHPPRRDDMGDRIILIEVCAALLIALALLWLN